MSAYHPRVVDTELDELLRELSAIALEGPKGVGKTATGVRRARTVFHLDDTAQREMANADPDRIVRATPPVLVDEWQHVPAVWDAVRRAVDRDTSRRFLLTGSASLANPPTHSGAGRIVTVRMRPLALSERGLVAPTVKLSELLSGESRPSKDRSIRAQLNGYLHRVVERDCSEQGHAIRRPDTLRRWMAAYAAATASTTSLEQIRDAATAGDGAAPTKVTVIACRNVLERLWLLDPVAGWAPSRNPFARLTQAPKHHLADPGLAARLLGVDEGALLSGAPGEPTLPRDGTLFGQLFESLVALSVRVLAQAAEATVGHLRTKEGRREVDLIVERRDHRVVAIEVRLSATVGDGDVRHLHWLADRLGDDLLDAVVVPRDAMPIGAPTGSQSCPPLYSARERQRRGLGARLSGTD